MKQLDSYYVPHCTLYEYSWCIPAFSRLVLCNLTEKGIVIQRRFILFVRLHSISLGM